MIGREDDVEIKIPKNKGIKIMIINKEGAAFDFEGRKYLIGQEVIATNVSGYNGLLGIITEIRDCPDKDTGNETPDIYCTFEYSELSCEISRLEKLFSDLYGEPKEIGEIGLDEVIMAPEMILPLSEIRKHSGGSIEAITEFRGEFQFLSNFYDAEICYEGLTFKNNEAAFQAMKDPSQAHRFTSLDAAPARRHGRLVHLRQDWESVKGRIMYEICLAKFTQNPELKEKLLATKEMTLIEGNAWGDTEWGVCNGKGKNMLGTILMCVREELR